MYIKNNNSPWLLDENNSVNEQVLHGNEVTDVAIIGGGIAGIATAYYTLHNTDKSVILLEANQIAHGATGHNGGFLASYFERTFSHLVAEFGLEMAAQAEREISTAWELLAGIFEQENLKTKAWYFTGYAACQTIEEVILHLRNNALRLKAGLSAHQVLISDQAAGLESIPKMYKNLYKLIPKSELLDILETDLNDYIAVLPDKKGCMNSAEFCQELVLKLLKEFPDRFKIYEYSSVKRLVIKADHAILNMVQKAQVISKQVVLCTNGFENIKIVNTNGSPIDAKFHHLVRGIVGYMAGYTEDSNRPPVEISYLPSSPRTLDLYTEEPYFYLTRRPFVDNSGEVKSLVCIGGPELLMDDSNGYTEDHEFSKEAREQIDNFLRFTYKHTPKENLEYKFLWHGLMGFTPNGVRLIGPEPRNPILYYNLGCNGVGLLPSIYGGKKISKFLAGEKIEPSIFDPKE